MKRRRINLLTLNLKKFDFESSAKKVQFSLIWTIVILVAILGGMAFANNYLSQQIEEVEKSKIPLTQYFQSNENFDKKIKLFIYKNNLLKSYIKDDANAYDYYNKLLTHINTISPEAQIKNFTVDNAKQTQFELVFPNYDNAQEFLNALETPEFIKPFEFLKMTGFDVTGGDSSGFSLILQGKFSEQ